MLENDTHFSSKKSAKVRNTSRTIFFWYIKISWKIMNFLYQNLHSTKKVDEKTTFPKSPICDPTLILWIFEKNRFFLKFFVQIYTLKKNGVFLSLFLKFFYKKVRNTTGTKFFWRFLILCEKCVINRKRSIFFSFSKQKLQIEHPYEGGGKKSSFFKINFLDY